MVIAYLGYHPWNPNVMYEVGYRHATNKAFVILTHNDNAKELPFDLKDLPHVDLPPYNQLEAKDEPRDKEIVKKIREHLISQKELIKPSTSPGVKFYYGPQEPSNARQDRLGILMDRVAGDIESVAKDPNINQELRKRAEQAADWLVKEHPRESDETLVTTLCGLLPRLKNLLADGEVNVFFSYKDKDGPIARTIAKKLESWSAGKLKVKHMADLSVEEVGRKWRKEIERTIPLCDWFLLLLPTPGDERDWVLYEAGYFSRGQGLAGRLVCLHHPDNKVSDALTAPPIRARRGGTSPPFLEALFRRWNWVPGMPALNPDLNQLDDKAAEIVELIQPPTGPGVKFCCGPHMEVAFEDASAVRGWEQLRRGRVIDSNKDCEQLFGLQVPKPFFGDWVREVSGGEQDREWIMQLARAVRAVGEGRQVPPIDACFRVPSGRRVQPRICAVRRRRTGQSVESIDILFNDAELPPATASMKPELAALAITLEYAVRYRYQLLEPFADRKLELKDVLDFQSRRTAILQWALRDRRFEDRSKIRERTMRAFVGEDKAVIQKMYERSDQLWREDGEGEMDRAIDNAKNGDTEALEGLIKELLDMTQSFLTVTSKRFAEVIAGS